MQTFNMGGTMLDRSDAPGNIQSSGLGVWTGRGHDFTASFEIFNYDSSGNLLGRVTVRGSFRVEHDSQLIAPKISVDFIDTSGNVFCNVATATLTGTRIPALAP